jgi:probable DNA metabolism protein
MELEKLRYVTDGTLEGLLTALFLAFEQEQQPDYIITKADSQISMFTSDVPILTSVSQATSMQETIIQTIGEQGYTNVKKLFLSDDIDAGGICYRYLRYTMPRGKRSLSHIANSAIADASTIIRQVQRESQFMIQFVRFADIGNGLYYAHISPKANVIPLIMGHFADRYNIQPFIIHDSGHCLSGVFDMTKWWLVEGVPQGISVSTADEDKYRELWRTFFKTIAIPERRNPTVQRSFMPKRFWGDMCEQRIAYTKRGEEKADLRPRDFE